MKNTLLFIAAMCILEPAHSQNQSEFTSMGGGGFTVGYGTMDVSALQAFAPAAVSNFSNNQLLMGGCGSAFIGRLVMGGGGTGISVTSLQQIV